MAQLPELAADPALERLLQIVAVIKLFTFFGVLRALRWRLRFPISRGRRTTYALGLFSMASALVLLVTNVSVAMVPWLFESTVVLLAMMALSDREAHRALSHHFPDPDRPPAEPVITAETAAEAARR